ncbi:hypothetical protein [Dolichospermum sp. UHCC 0259]|uniref:hypothetical protein n=1 Tax=Dolichospermum sp. UHCC 0259 TaxID=2590010 RepID=UPI001580EA76|nr:hypothetical protein [Dolichospermum sp. UHCC 0259]
MSPVKVEECKEKIGEVKTQMDGKLENLKNRMKSKEQRIEKMENLVDSLNHKNDTIANNIKIEIQAGKDDLDDAQDKSSNLRRVLEIAASLSAGVGLAAQGVAQLLSSLQSIGLLR